MISIKICEKPENLKHCKMMCDGVIHEKLNNYPLTSKLNSHSFNILIGRPKSGKSTLLDTFFRSPKLLKKCYNKIYLFKPGISSAYVDDDIFSVLPKEQKFNELTFNNLSSVYKEMEQEAMLKSNVNNCIIMDDMGAYLKNADIFKLFKDILFNRRALRCTVFFLVQTFYSVPRQLRIVATNYIIFKVSKSEMRDIFKEAIEQDETLVKPICDIVFDKPYEFLCVNLDDRTMFKGWDQLIVNDA